MVLDLDLPVVDCNVLKFGSFDPSRLLVRCYLQSELLNSTDAKCWINVASRLVDARAMLLDLDQLTIWRNLKYTSFCGCRKC